MDLTKCYDINHGYNIRKQASWQDCVEEATERLSKSLKGKNAGENNPCAKYTEAQIKYVIELLMDETLTYTQIAEMAQVDRSVVLTVWDKSNWKYLTDGIEFPRRNHKNYNRGLTDDQVKEIIQRLLNGEKNPSIAKDYNTSNQTIQNIRNHAYWKELTEGIVFPEVHKGGENSGFTNLKNEDVLNIIDLYNSGYSYNQISEKTGVRKTIIGGIITGKTWKKFSNKITRKPPKAAPGSINGNSKLTEEDVINIIRESKHGKNQFDLQTLYPNVKPDTIWRIIRGWTWKHINRDEIN